MCQAVFSAFRMYSHSVLSIQGTDLQKGLVMDISQSYGQDLNPPHLTTYTCKHYPSKYCGFQHPLIRFITKVHKYFIFRGLP